MILFFSGIVVLVDRAIPKIPTMATNCSLGAATQQTYLHPFNNSHSDDVGNSKLANNNFVQSLDQQMLMNHQTDTLVDNCNSSGSAFLNLNDSQKSKTESSAANDLLKTQPWKKVPNYSKKQCEYIRDNFH